MALDNSNSRIYVVLNKQTGEKRLVEATTQAQAIRHCVMTIYRADVASAKTLAHYMGEGLRIEKAALVDPKPATPKTEESTTTAQPQQ